MSEVGFDWDQKGNLAEMNAPKIPLVYIVGIIVGVVCLLTGILL